MKYYTQIIIGFLCFGFIFFIQVYLNSTFLSNTDFFYSNVIDFITSLFVIFLVLILYNNKTLKKTLKTNQLLQEKNKNETENIEQKYKLVFNTTGDCLILLDGETGQILDANKKALETYEYTLEEIVKLKNTDVSAEPTATQNAIKTDLKYVKTRYHKKKNGTVFPVEIVATYFYENGKKLSVVSIRDISERINIEEQSKKIAEELQQMNNTKDKFFSIIAHDLRNPFTSIIGVTEYLLANINETDKDEIENSLKLISYSGRQTFNLLENLLDWSYNQYKKKPFSPEMINIKQISDEVCESLQFMAAQKQISLKNYIDEKYETVADVNMIKSVFRNLITNAIKYSKLNEAIVINIKEDKDFLNISVKDNGVGIKQEYIETIFSGVNFTTNGTNSEKGTGLGLMLCKEFIEKHNGYINVESNEGDGTTFIFKLPTIENIKI